MVPFEFISHCFSLVYYHLNWSSWFWFFFFFSKFSSLSVSLFATMHDMQNLNSQTRYWTCAPSVEAWNLNCWTAREVPGLPDSFVVFLYPNNQFSSIQFSRSVVSDSLQPMNRSTPGLPVHHQLPEFTQTHVHRVSDAIQPSHPLSSPSPPAPNPSQHQSFFQWVNSLHEVAKVLEFQR